MSEIIVEVQGRWVPLTRAIVIEEYACAAVAAAVLYDYLLTLDLEVHMIWRRKLGLPTLIFLANRYSCIAFSITLIYSVGTQAECVYTGFKGVVKNFADLQVVSFILQLVLGGLLSITLAGFFALRTSAIWGCSRTIFVIVLLAYLPGFALNYCTMLLRNLPTVLAIQSSFPNVNMMDF
ncbi:hypothetical protein BDY19DRAFT_997827 [Irpex rosettiformis]|uniref:Uncharacterized protein n=1 Tax=Irpex rosettiformis TaxID=378272 RepID=A0ACB8TQV4_9APHY|nr:hypothetical protein BDY19DRAFT_997827 [Irpex rosettiformis]